MGLIKMSDEAKFDLKFVAGLFAVIGVLAILAYL